MTKFSLYTKHPVTGTVEPAIWILDLFGRHRYGVRFVDGSVFREDEIESVEVNGVGAEASAEGTTVTHWDGVRK